MSCQKCNSERVASILGKCSDMFTFDEPSIPETYEGYVLDNIGIGGGDYIEFSYCLECGQIQGQFPVEDPDIN